mgnify:FL=1
MSLLDITTGVILLSALAGIFTGLDKLAGTLLFLALLVGSQYFNTLCRQLTGDNCWLQNLLMRRGFSRIQTGKILRITGALAVAGLCCLLLYQIYWLSLGFNLTVYDSFNFRFFYLAVHLLLVFYAVFAVRTLQIHENPDTAARWYRGLGYLSGYQSLIFAVFLLTSYLPEAESDVLNTYIDYGFFSVFISMALLSAEILTAAVRSLRLAFSGSDQVALPIPFFISFFAAEDTVKKSLIRSIETISGIDVSRSEIVAFGLRIFEPVLITAFLAVWLTSAIVIVPADQQAIFRHFGKIAGSNAAGPGLHFKLPWPFATVELHRPHQIRTLNIGFEPDPKQKNIIWAKSHATNYFHLIVGNGVEIIAIDCQILFRVDDLFRYVTSMQNPEEFISATAYRHLTRETVAAAFDEIITRDRRILADQLRRNIQVDLDAAGLGAAVVEVVFLAMHPPIEVAEAYEDVISAQTDKLTYVLKANTENTHKMFMSKANAHSKEFEARSYAANTVAKAIGDASSFSSRSAAFEAEPDLEKFRLRLDRLQQLLSGKPFYVVDKTLMRSNDKMYLNLQTW